MANFYGSYIGYGSGGGASVELFQGEFYGYCHGGQQAGNQSYDRIDRWDYASDSAATDVGNLAQISMYNAGCTSGTDGFCITSHAAYPISTGIQKYSYASATGDATSHGDVTTGAGSPQGCSDMVNQYGYRCGGNNPVANRKDKFAFLSNVTASDAGDLAIHHHAGGGSNDLTHGYNQSGHVSGSSTDTAQIDRFAFAAGVDSVDCGDVTQGRGGTDNGASSTIRGYLVQGYSISGGGYSNRIDNHTFASSITATDVGDVSSTLQGNGANCSTTYGYCFGGQPPATLDTIWKWSFASDTQAGADIGYNLTLARVYASGSQH